MKKYIPLSVPNLKGNELKYVTKAIEEEWVSTGGAYIEEFEKNIASYVGSKGAVACQNGTAGLHLAILANEIGEGDGVIVPTLTFIAAVNPVKYAGATPFFMDCDNSLCMDMDKVKEFCENECDFHNDQLTHKKTGIRIKALLFVHVFGNIGNIEKALLLCRKYKIKLIEDATEAIGSYITKGFLKGEYAGTIGDVGVFSFNGNKIITTGGGGMLVSDDEELLKKAKYLSTQSKDDALYYIHNNIGYNYRMTNIQAAMGIAQLERLEEFIRIKNDNYNHYIDMGIDLLEFRQDIRSNKWFYSYLSDYRDELINYLQDNSIQARPIWNLIHKLPPYIECEAYRIELAEYYWSKVVNVPCSTNLSFEEIEYICSKLKEFNDYE